MDDHSARAMTEPRVYVVTNNHCEGKAAVDTLQLAALLTRPGGELTAGTLGAVPGGPGDLPQSQGTSEPLKPEPAAGERHH